MSIPTDVQAYKDAYNEDPIVAHRHVNGLEDLRYALLCQQGDGGLYTLVFYWTGVKWECLWDSDEWEGTLQSFKVAKKNKFEGC